MNKPTTLFGGLTGKHMAAICGVDEHRVNEATKHAFDLSVVFMMKNTPAFLRMMADRMENPTPGITAILKRRKLLLDRMAMPI